MKRAVALSLFFIAVTSSTFAEEPDKRFVWSSEKFSSECGIDWPSYLSATRTWFSDRNYSNRWSKFQPETLKSCDDCYRVGDIAELPVGKRIARLSLSSESGDWFYEITYCFDDSGKLQGVMSIFNSSWSYVRVYSVENGVPKVQASKWQELISGKEIERPGASEDFKAQWSDLPIYKSFSKLPFARLVQQ